MLALRDSVSLSVDALKAHKMRFILTVLGLTMGVATLYIGRKPERWTDTERESNSAALVESVAGHKSQVAGPNSQLPPAPCDL